MRMDFVDYPETSLTISLPEELGIIDNVWVHITLLNNTYIPLKAKLYSHFRHYSRTGEEWPKLYDENTKQQITNWKINKDGKPNTTVFGIIYKCYDRTFFKGSFVITFTSWKCEVLKYYYTERKYFDLDVDDEYFF